MFSVPGETHDECFERYKADCTLSVKKMLKSCDTDKLFKPSNALEYYNRGLAYEIMQKHEDALSDYEKAYKMLSDMSMDKLCNSIKNEYLRLEKVVAQEENEKDAKTISIAQ